MFWKRRGMKPIAVAQARLHTWRQARLLMSNCASHLFSTPLKLSSYILY